MKNGPGTLSYWKTKVIQSIFSWGQNVNNGDGTFRLRLKDCWACSTIIYVDYVNFVTLIYNLDDNVSF